MSHALRGVWRAGLTLGLIALAFAGEARAQEFSGDSAYAFLKVIAGEIGPRPMGSPAEQRAMIFAVSKFAAYGCQQSYIMPMTEAREMNTRSGIAVGILRGTTGRMIVIGGHMDSAGPDIPGADDDGSGAASVIELCRVLSKTPHHSTLVFCCWGGEEEGLLGSKHFVRHFPEIDSVDLMLQIDMADGSGELILDPDGPKQTSAPKWLVNAALDIFYRRLGYSDLVYHTQSATVNSIGAGATGSDHFSFLERGIPAIDFTSDVTYPIHTPLDNLQNFNPSGLKRSGELVLKLAERFDNGVPSRDTDEYWLVQAGNRALFFSHPLLRVFIAVAVILALLSLAIEWRRRPPPDPSRRIRWSGAKIVLYVLIVQAFIWLSENVIGLVRGYRFPWVNHFAGYVIFGLLAGLLGLWVVLRMAGRLRLSDDVAPLHLRALILLMVFLLLFGVTDTELAVYPALALFFYSLAMLVRRPWLKLILFLCSPYWIVRLLFPEELGLLQRQLTQLPLSGILDLVYNLSFVVVFTLLSLPFACAFAAVYRSGGRDYFWLKRFRKPAGLALAGVATAGVGIFLLYQPVYDHLWEQAVKVTQEYTAGADSSRIVISSGEYLSGLMLDMRGHNSVLLAREVSDTLFPGAGSAISWCRFNVHPGIPVPWDSTDSVRTVQRVVEIHSVLRPYRVSITYSSRTPLSISSSWAISSALRGQPSFPRRRALIWESFPDSILIVPVTFSFREGERVRERIEVTYDSLYTPFRCTKEFAYCTERTVVTREDSFGIPRPEDTMAALRRSGVR